MKKLIVMMAILFLTSPVLAFELPADKHINKIAVEKGIIFYSNAIEHGQNLEDAYMNRAFLYFLSENIEKAICDYDELISINPKNEEYYLNRGYLKHISKKQLEALKDYDMALSLKPNYAFALNNKGVALSELGKISESLNAYNEAIKSNPNYADAYFNRGNLKVKTENNTEAIEDFDLAIKLNPTDYASYNNRGVAKRKLNYNIGALSDFSIAIKLNPEDITAFANRGRLKKRYYDSEGAEEDFKNAIAVAETKTFKHNNINSNSQLVLENQSKAKEISSNIKESEVLEDNVQKISYNTSKTNIKNSVDTSMKASVVKVDKSQNQIDTNKNDPQILTKPVYNPNLAECYYIRALQKYILQNRESALKDLNTAIQYNPKYAEAYYYRAAIKRDFKDEGFVDDYRKAIQLNPSLKAVNDADVLMILKI